MPLFMDRHDLPGATAEELVEAHAKDLGPAAEHGVRLLAYWFDAESGGAFCFADAPSPAELTALHRASHGLVPNKIISVSQDSMLRFLGRIDGPVDGALPVSPFRIILFTDLEGSTSILQEVGEPAFMVLLTEHDLIIRRALMNSWGREVKHTGDGIMAAFEDVAQALACAVAIQDGFDARSREGGAPVLRVRIGMAAGEPVEHNDDLFGSAVNLASRICNAADAGHILVSDVVGELGSGSGFRLEEADIRALKGFSLPVRVFELVR